MRWLVLLTGVAVRQLMEVAGVQRWVASFYWGRLVGHISLCKELTLVFRFFK